MRFQLGVVLLFAHNVSIKSNSYFAELLSVDDFHIWKTEKPEGNSTLIEHEHTIENFLNYLRPIIATSKNEYAGNIGGTWISCIRSNSHSRVSLKKDSVITFHTHIGDSLQFSIQDWVYFFSLGTRISLLVDSSSLAIYVKNELTNKERFLNVYNKVDKSLPYNMKWLSFKKKLFDAFGLNDSSSEEEMSEAFGVKRIVL